MSSPMTNCCNCGAVMEYSKQDYGSMYKCPYCGTEHHIDLLGRIEEYKVKFMFQGHIFEAYLTSVTCEPQELDYTCLCDDTMTTKIMPPEYEFVFRSTMLNKGDPSG